MNIKESMNKAIELAKKCGFTEFEAKTFLLNINAFYEAAQREQIEKDAMICDELGDLSKEQVTDSAWQHGECAAAIRNQLSKEND